MIVGPVIALADRLLVNTIVAEGPTKLPLILIEEASAAVRHYSLGKILHLSQKRTSPTIFVEEIIAGGSFLNTTY